MSYRAGRRRSPRERRQAKANRKLGLTVAMAVLVGVILVIALISADKWNPELDAALCPVGRPITAETVVLIDVTDEWNPTQQFAIRQALSDVQAAVPRFGRLTLYALEVPAVVPPDPDLMVCNPGRPSDFEEFPIVGEFGARVVANPDALLERWEGGYADAISNVLATRTSEDPLPETPIMETIRGIALAEFGGGDTAPDLPQRLIVISDLLQNSDEYSLYRDPSWDASDGSGMADISALGTSSLDGVTVEVFLLDRTFPGRTNSQSRAGLIEVWDEYFSAQGASLVRVRRIEG